MTKNLVTLKLYPETCRRNFALETMEDVSENPDSRVVIRRAGGIALTYRLCIFKKMRASNP